MSSSRIADHGYLADGRTGALVDRDGSVNWWCPGRFDAPSVFAALLDRDAGGGWSIRPRGAYRTERDYLPDTLVLRTVFTTDTGSVALVDALALEPGARGHDIGRRPPDCLIRSVQGLSGRVDLELTYRPRFEYGMVQGYPLPTAAGLVATAGPATLTLSGQVSLDVDGPDATASFAVSAGDRVDFALQHTSTYGQDRPVAPVDVPHALDETVEGWRSWADLHTYQGRYPDLIRRNALIVQGLTYQPSGAVVAAPTTSLPEKRGGDRNYDYRFGWLRDFSLTLRALWVAACPDESTRLFRWVAQTVGRVDGQPVPIMCGVEGERDVSERVVHTLRGYADSRPIRVGNEAWQQRQADVPGEVLDAAWLLRDYLEPMPADVRDLLRSLADRSARDWRQPDAGMWEARDAERHYLSSKVFCWVALDRAIGFGKRLGGPAELDRWRAARAEIRETVLRDGWHPEVGAYTGAFGSTELDASVLLLPCVGFLPATDPRMWATIELIHKRLSVGGLIRRWDDDPAGFFLCSFWMVQCLAYAGRQEQATALFESVVARANDLGLLAEQIDPATGEQLGNFPQAFSQVGLIGAAWSLTEPTPLAGPGRPERSPEPFTRAG
ncbi:glycoside hydrolase family 15 protein [Plantactinospora sp. KBS50]|uniref:glycoside hydrolase family 15 protein n=1 Tax=Plantactinospora sp. KBS50 TaxID=2024580 RepID=UPI000BAAD5CD|nr:glycoside hydrolase family 15 protein [Plantactinospora sp. KBS50]ASW57675.1 glycoside hydrolase family 15 [Plantactinospora sp. KBS50]